MRVTISRINGDPELLRVLREIAAQLNVLSEGRITNSYTALTAAPTTGTWNQGDRILNKTPTELGTVGSKYTVDGWTCVASGTPGTWVQRRCLTGN